jgi:hypothetical protein
MAIVAGVGFDHCVAFCVISVAVGVYNILDVVDTATQLFHGGKDSFGRGLFEAGIHESYGGGAENEENASRPALSDREGDQVEIRSNLLDIHHLMLLQ